MDQESTSSATATSNALIGPLTIVHLVLIALLGLAVIVAVILVARIRARAARQRSAAEEASERLAEIHEVAPVTAPPPPPLADTPVVAAAPLDAAPATLAGDMEPAREVPAAPAQADDLTRMKGVGPKLAATLAGFGYTRFQQIGALSQIEADALDAQLGAFRGRLARDRVVEQARYLAKGDVEAFESVFGKL
ncbi:hypothetical protein D1610_01140 [Sphingomonas gilva]|uniref:Uncharacterized protein n=1 Tax=Sphingomonas gilva TaxID=2305907 RepID=A0A396RTQ5_9SPHN|nr:hypothetical protein [Sphingomonas gilva]RHW18792.1 hypothetical protein D1610_01140 [Sphingomonas gilva]